MHDVEIVLRLIEAVDKTNDRLEKSNVIVVYF